MFNRFLVLALALVPVLAQVSTPPPHATFVPMGPEILLSYAGTLPKGTGIWGVSVCAGRDLDYSTNGGTILEAGVQRGVILFPPQVLDSFATRIKTRTKWVLVADIGAGVSLGGASVTSSGIIKAGSPWVYGFVTGAGVLQYVSGKLKDRTPDFSKLTTLRLPVTFTAGKGRCTEQLPVLGRWTVGSRAVSVDLH